MLKTTGFDMLQKIMLAAMGVAATLFLLAKFSNGQPSSASIRFANPSFEGPTGADKSPDGWASATPGSTPDMLPGAWGLTLPALDGKACVGLVTREDGTSEDLGQTLSEPLRAGICYTFSIFLKHADKYVGFNQPARLRIWGGGARGKKEVLLASSPLVDHSDWREIKFQFSPKKDIRHITFEAYFAPGVLFKYKGNVLLDKCSTIERCNRA